MVFISQICLLKIKYILESTVRDDVKTNDNGGMSDNSKKAMDSINLTRQYKELALTGREVVHFFGRQAKVEWNHGREDLVE